MQRSLFPRTQVRKMFYNVAFLFETMDTPIQGLHMCSIYPTTVSKLSFYITQAHKTLKKNPSQLLLSSNQNLIIQ